MFAIQSIKGRSKVKTVNASHPKEAFPDLFFNIKGFNKENIRLYQSWEEKESCDWGKICLQLHIQRVNKMQKTLLNRRTNYSS